MCCLTYLLPPLQVWCHFWKLKPLRIEIPQKKSQFEVTPQHCNQGRKTYQVNNQVSLKALAQASKAAGPSGQFGLTSKKPTLRLPKVPSTSHSKSRKNKASLGTTIAYPPSPTLVYPNSTPTFTLMSNTHSSTMEARTSNLFLSSSVKLYSNTSPIFPFQLTFTNQNPPSPSEPSPPMSNPCQPWTSKTLNDEIDFVMHSIQTKAQQNAPMEQDIKLLTQQEKNHGANSCGARC